MNLSGRSAARREEGTGAGGKAYICHGRKLEVLIGMGEGASPKSGRLTRLLS